MTKEARALTAEELEKVNIVLGDALPYELSMLEAAALYMESDDFCELDPNESRNALKHNATIEAFWTHARCLIEFFNRGRNHNLQASSASAKDFTSDDYQPSDAMRKLDGTTKTRINEQISHVGFCRKTGNWDKLGTSEINHVKATNCLGDLLLHIETDSGPVGEIVAHQCGIGGRAGRLASAIASENRAARP
jgi:hypothetical protein